MSQTGNIKIAVIGQGYVGLPLAVEFSKYYKTFGFDTSIKRIEELNRRVDSTLQLTAEEISQSTLLSFTTDIIDISDCCVYIITVPTPIDSFKAPDLSFLLKASADVGGVLKKGDTVIYESTVYPGCTEEECIPHLEKHSNLVFNKDFFVGYSPERINPGDKINTLTKIIKVTSGSNSTTAQFVDELYNKIIEAGTHLAPSIKVAEAAKAIENAQRDVNISFVNELALIFDKIGIDTNDVIEAAATKWNFLKFKPGLVGGHCIGVDPYYLAHKAEALGYLPQVILSGRRVNDNMGMFVANKLIKLLVNKGHNIKEGKILLLGFTFKENCPDIRNTRVIDIYQELVQFGLSVDIYDPWANPEEVRAEYHVKLLNHIPDKKYIGVIIATGHSDFVELDYQKYKEGGAIIFDTKSIIPREFTDARL